MTKYAYVVRNQNQEITGIFTSVNAVKLSLEASLNENRGYSIDIDRIKLLSIDQIKIRHIKTDRLIIWTIEREVINNGACMFFYAKKNVEEAIS